MPAVETYVIVGASLAGAKAAQALREEGFAGAVVLIGAEHERPYERPPLSKDLLLGKAEPGSVFVHDAGWYADNSVELRLGTRVTSVDRAERQVHLEDGSAVGYTRLLLATGSSPRRLPVPGADLDGRAVPAHARLTARPCRPRSSPAPPWSSPGRAGSAWRRPPPPARRAARSPSSSPAPTPLHRQVGPELGEIFGGLHRSHGVQFRLGEGISELRGDGRRSCGRQVVTSGGAELPADVVVVGIGAAPNVGLAADAGLEVDNGVLTDESLRTSDPDIFAAGDIANAVNPLFGRRIRVEHWANALNGGPAAARAMLGQPVSYDRVPYFFSDQYELGMETAGLPEPGGYDQVVFRGDPQALEFVAFWLSSGAVVAGMNVNVWDVNDDIQRLIRARTAVDAARLADPDVPLGDLLA